MNLNVNVENKSQNIYGESFTKEDVIAAIRRAADGKFASITEAALAIKGRVCATRPVLADREDVEAVHRVLIGCGWEETLTAEEAVACNYYLSCNKEEQAILRLVFQVGLRDPETADRMREERARGESHPELVAPAMSKAIADVQWLLAKRVA